MTFVGNGRRNGDHNAPTSIEVCMFDLDDTLYPLSSGLAAACTKNIRDYMVERLGKSPEDVEELSLRMYSQHGTTMAGLRELGHIFDFDEYHAFVHGRLPYQQLKPDPLLRQLILSLPQRRFVFTNGDRKHAARCLSALQLEGCFERVICFEDVMSYPPIAAAPQQLIQESGREVSDCQLIEDSWQSPAGPRVCCKPQAEAFHRALAMARADPHRTIFFDDSARNILSAKRVGLSTVLVGRSKRTEGAEWAMLSLHNMREVVPQLWGEEDSSAAQQLERVEVECVKA